MKNIQITVFHKVISERNYSYVPKVFNCKRYYIKRGANSNVSAKGFIPNSEFVFRISEKTDGLIATGDRIMLGVCKKLDETAMTVRYVHENRFGSRHISHTKVVCG